MSSSRRLINEDYLNYVRRLCCIGCYLEGRINIYDDCTSEAHHEALSQRFAGYKRMCDYSAVPLCRYHHALRHDKHGREKFWEFLAPGVGIIAAYTLSMRLMVTYATKHMVKLDPGLTARTMNFSSLVSMEEIEWKELFDDLADEVHTQYKLLVESQSPDESEIEDEEFTA